MDIPSLAVRRNVSQSIRSSISLELNRMCCFVLCTKCRRWRSRPRKCRESGMTYATWFSLSTSVSKAPRVIRPAWMESLKPADQAMHLSWDSWTRRRRASRFQPRTIWISAGVLAAMDFGAERFSCHGMGSLSPAFGRYATKIASGTA